MDYTKIFLLLLFVSLTSYSADDSNSKKYESLNSVSPERTNWVLEQNNKINNRLKNSLNFKMIEQSFRKAFDNEKIIQTETGKNGSSFKLIDRGLGKAQELEISTLTTKQVVFSTNTLARNNTYNALQFIINSAETKVAIAFDYKGSTDDFLLLVVDLQSDKILLEKKLINLRGGKNSFFFKDDSTIVVVDQESKEKWGLKAYPLDTQEAAYYLYDKTWMETGSEGWTFVYGENTPYQLISKDEKVLVENLPDGDVHFLGLRNNYFYFSVEGKLGTQFVKVLKDTPLKIEVFLNVDGKIDGTYFLKNYLVLKNSWGVKRNITAYQLDSLKKSMIELPDFVSLISIKESNKNNILTLKIQSELIASQSVEWNLIENIFENTEKLEKMMLWVPSISIVTKYVEIKSFDGTLVPIKMIYREGLELKNVPIYIESYGGFNSDSYLHPTYNYLNAEFVRHSGIYIGTALRGGGEFGEDWHKAGALLNKMKTYEDLASVSKWLIHQGISTKDKIISAGSSNGGLTVAATGLLYPQFFGLVIPHNGVLDMLGKEILDKQFDQGWSYEYGNTEVTENYDYIKLFSPLELINNLSNGPRFLIINGRNDSRVNPAHSIKFTKAGTDVLNSNIELLSLNNSGHFNVSIAYNDYIAWRALVVKWSTIYDFLNIKY